MIDAWNRFRDETEHLAYSIGETLRDVVRVGEWDELDVAGKRGALDAARGVIHDRHGLVRETWIEPACGALAEPSDGLEPLSFTKSGHAVDGLGDATASEASHLVTRAADVWSPLSS